LGSALRREAFSREKEGEVFLCRVRGGEERRFVLKDDISCTFMDIDVFGTIS
jgi:hypothetical protein